MHKTVLITGASSGIGYEFAKVFAREGYSLILIARDAEGLAKVSEEIHATHPQITIQVMAKDLAETHAAQAIYNELHNHNLRIDVLVNNAGFGGFGHFTATDLQREEDMIQVNITTVTALTKLFVKDMVARKSGKILNVASTAAFQPGPLMAVYYATKAYVLSFSEALSNELKGTGVTVTALCPGPTQSGFVAAANLQTSQLFKNKKLPTAQEVAEYGYASLMSGKVVAIHGLQNKLGVFVERFIPRWLVRMVVRKMQETS